MAAASFPLSSAAARVDAPDSGRPILLDAFRSLQREHGFVPLRVEGKLPPSLRGVLYRNGPGHFERKRPRTHWFDGNGVVSAIRLDGVSARGAARVLHSPSTDHDARRSRPRFAGYAEPMSIAQRVRAVFGGQSARNPANIAVIPWQGRLFGAYEMTPPLEIDPRTLEPIGETDLEGVVRGAMQAHAHYVPGRKATYAIGLRVGRFVELDVFELPSEGSARRLASIPLAGIAEVHDFFVTERHIVIMVPPLLSSVENLLWRGSFLGAVKWQPHRGTEVIVVPIDHPDRFVRFQTEAFFFWHSVNAYEDKDARIVLDVIRYPDWPSTNAWIQRTMNARDGEPSAASLWRGWLDLHARSIAWQEVSTRACEFGSVHPAFGARHARAAWFAGFDRRHEGRGAWDRLLRCDLENGNYTEIDPGSRGVVSEPILVQKSEKDTPPSGGGAETDVWVLAYVHDLSADATFLGIWDGPRAEDGPVARVWFDQQLPATLHGTFLREA